jgi:hypothetical protein
MRTVLLFLFCLLPIAAFSDTVDNKTVNLTGTFVTTDNLSQRITTNGTIPDIDSAVWLIEKLLIDHLSSSNKTTTYQNLTSDKKFYCLIHVVYFADSQTGTGTRNATVASHPPISTYYIYHTGDAWNPSGTPQARILGLSSFYVLTIAVNYPVAAADAPTSLATNLHYTFAITHRLPANVQNILSIFSGFDQTHVDKAIHATSTNVCGYAHPDGIFVPSTINVTSAFSQDDGTTFSSLDKTPLQINDEGLYRWDVSLGVPITSYKQVQFQNNIATPTTIDQRNLMVLGDLYIKARDLSGSNFSPYPYAVGGVAFASKPLQQAFAGVGWGPAIANVYIGAMIVTNHPDATHTNTSAKFGFGLNIPVRDVAAKLGWKTQIGP